MDDVDGELFGRLQFFQCFGQGVFGVSEFERYGALGAEDGDALVASDALEFALKEACFAEGG